MVPDGHAEARRMVFGEVAEQYDAGRSGYADAVAAEVVAYAELGERAAVEVGAGTGKATLPFAGLLAERGTPLVCVEPDVRMAAVLRRHTARYPNVQVEECAFEQWEPGGRRHGLLFAAAAWNFLDSERRWELAHAALAPGGALALIFGPHGIKEPSLRAGLAAIAERHGVTGDPHRFLASDFASDEPGDWDRRWPEAECRRDGRFTDLSAIRLRQDRHYDTDRYLRHLTSLSAYRLLPDAPRERAFAEARSFLDAQGGGIDVHQVTDVFLARAR